MDNSLSHRRVSFSTKVLLPVVTIMVLLLGVTVWLLNSRVTGQFEMEARRLLAEQGQPELEGDHRPDRYDAGGLKT